MLDITLVERALNTLECYYLRVKYWEWWAAFSILPGESKRLIIRNKAVGLVLHDRILTGRIDHDGKPEQKESGASE